MRPNPPKSETPFASNLLWNVGQNGFQWTRLAELVCMPRVSARDLDSQIKFCKKSSRTLPDYQKRRWTNSCFFIGNTIGFWEFQKPRYQQTTVQKVPAQVLADAPRRVSMSAASFSPRSWFWDPNLQKEFKNLARLSNFGIHEFLHLWTVVFLN